MKEITCHIIFRCSCNFESKVKENENQLVLSLANPFEPTQKYDLRCARITGSDTFLEVDDPQKPTWAYKVHYLLPIDVTKIGIPHFDKFAHIFATIQSSTVGLPQCWLQPVLSGSGLFYGLWDTEPQGSETKNTPSYLRVIDGGRTKDLTLLL